MKHPIEQRKANGFKDYLSLSLTTFGVGYIPGAPGTYGSAVGLAIYLAVGWWQTNAAAHGVSTGLRPEFIAAFHLAINVILLTSFTLIGIWAAGRSTELFGNNDPSPAVVDEVVGQLITFLFIPFTTSWKLILAGFLLFRLFDIWKPYPIDLLQSLPGGIGICADDILAGAYAGVCLAVIYAVSFWL
jgi:phosphatidylglycerophosphatase A